MTDLPRKIRQRRKLLRLTQTQLAQRLGITQAYLAEIEKGRKRPSLEVLEKLCDTMGCSADYLLGIPQPGQAMTLKQPDVPSSLLSRGITQAMLSEIEERNISGDELRLAIKLAQTMREESHKQ